MKKVKVTPIDKPIVENTSFKFKRSAKTKNIFKELDQVHKYTKELYNQTLFVLKQVYHEIYGDRKVNAIDEKGNPIYLMSTKKDQNGQIIPDVDENGVQKYFLNTEGNKIPKKTKELNPLWTKKQENHYKDLVHQRDKLKKSSDTNLPKEIKSSNKKELKTVKSEIKILNKVRYLNGHPGHIKKHFPELFNLIKELDKTKTKKLLNEKGELISSLTSSFLNTIVMGFENKGYSKYLSKVVRQGIIDGLFDKFQGTWTKRKNGDLKAKFPKYINESGEKNTRKIRSDHQVGINFSGTGKFRRVDDEIVLPLWKGNEKKNHQMTKIPFPNWRFNVNGSKDSYEEAFKDKRNKKYVEKESMLYNYINDIKISFINKDNIKIILTTIDKSKHKETDNIIKNVVAVDPGMRQWVTSFDSNGNKLVLSEKTLKEYKDNINYRNSKIKKLQQQLPYKLKGIPKEERKTQEERARSIFETKKIQKQRVKLENYKETFLNQIAKEIVKFWKECEVNLVYLPSVEKITQDLKKRANEKRAKNKDGGYGGFANTRQVSQNVPIGRLFDIISDKCTREQITTIRNVSEWYTSKACFLNLDEIKKGTDFSGTRVKGNYLTKINDKDVVVDSDINGAANILRKSLGEIKLSDHLDSPVNKKTIKKLLSDLESLTPKERFEILDTNKNTLKLSLENNHKPKIKKTLKKVKIKKEISR